MRERVLAAPLTTAGSEPCAETFAPRAPISHALASSEAPREENA